MQEEREREEEERLLELKDEEYDLLDEDSLQENIRLSFSQFNFISPCYFLLTEH